MLAQKCKNGAAGCYRAMTAKEGMSHRQLEASQHSRSRNYDRKSDSQSQEQPEGAGGSQKEPGGAQSPHRHIWLDGDTVLLFQLCCLSGASKGHAMAATIEVTLSQPSLHSCAADAPMHLSRSRSRGHRQTEEPPVGEWKEHKAPSGRTYYCNTVTSCASWEKPGAEHREPGVPVKALLRLF